jgi:hypothetical protein
LNIALPPLAETLRPLRDERQDREGAGAASSASGLSINSSVLLASKAGRDGSLGVHQDMDLSGPDVPMKGRGARRKKITTFLWYDANAEEAAKH